MGSVLLNPRQTLLSISPNCTFFAAAVASVFPDGQKGGEKNKRGQKKKKEKEKSHETVKD